MNRADELEDVDSMKKCSGGKIFALVFALISIAISVSAFFKAYSKMTSAGASIPVILYSMMIYIFIIAFAITLLWVVFDKKYIDGLISTIGFVSLGALFHGLHSGVLCKSFAYLGKLEYWVLSIQVFLISSICFAHFLESRTKLSHKSE